MENEAEILLVEDNPNDAELAIRALNKNKLTNNVIRGLLLNQQPDINYLIK